MHTLVWRALTEENTEIARGPTAALQLLPPRAQWAAAPPLDATWAAEEAEVARLEEALAAETVWPEGGALADETARDTLLTVTGLALALALAVFLIYAYGLAHLSDHRKQQLKPMGCLTYIQLAIVKNADLRNHPSLHER